MLDSFYKTFESFVVEFSARRVAAVLLLAALGIVGFVIFEWYTSYFWLARLERATGILERLSALKLTGREQFEVVESEVVSQLRNILVPPATTASTPGQLLSWKWEFFAGAAPWVLFATFYTSEVRKDPKNWSGFLGALFFGVLFGFAGLLIPNGWATVTVLTAFSLGHFSLFVVVVLIWQARNTARSVRAAAG